MILIRAPVGKIDRQSIDADGSNSTENTYEGYWTMLSCLAVIMDHGSSRIDAY
eukprot:SAG31_NODE_5833_length_2303_cov_2.727314_1_plen_53_part_00